MIRHCLIIGILSLAVLGCKGPSGTSPAPRAAAESPAAGPSKPPYSSDSAAPLLDPAKALALVDGKAVTPAALLAPLLEQDGGQVLAEWMLDRGLEQRLAQQGQQLSDRDVAAEQDLLRGALSNDAHEAQRLVEELRQRRGLGDLRFRQLLTRNAGLRRLVQSDVTVTDAAVQQAYDLTYGPRYEVRLVTTDTAAQAADIVKRARAGESFIDLAIHHSTDASRAQGGLLPPISPADATFPAAVRSVVAGLAAGAVSDPVALERGYAVMKLERKIDSKGIPFDDVKDALRTQVRRQVERMLMQRLARQIVAQTDVVVLDPSLQQSWERQKKAMADER